MPINRLLFVGLMATSLAVTGACGAEQPVAVELRTSTDFDPEDPSLRFLFSGDSIRIRWRAEGLSMTQVTDGKLRLRACARPGTVVMSPPHSYDKNFTMSPVPAGFWPLYLEVESLIGTTDTFPPVPVEIPAGDSAGITLEPFYQNITLTIAATRDRKVGTSWQAVQSTYIPVAYRNFGWLVDFPPCPPHAQGAGG